MACYREKQTIKREKKSKIQQLLLLKREIGKKAAAAYINGLSRKRDME